MSVWVRAVAAVGTLISLLLGVAFKAQAAERWVAAVNADGRGGVGRYAICRDVNLVPKVIDEAVDPGGDV